MSNSRDFLFGWSLPLFRVAGISVSMHLLFVLMMVWYLWPFNPGWSVEAAFWGILFGSVLLHEFGHSLACRSVGGKADRILIWPFGGLAECAPPPHPLASLWTTLCGPLVNLFLMAAAASFLAMTQMQADLPMPVSLDPWHMIRQGVPFASPAGEWVAVTYKVNYLLFVFNMAFPCYPMDGGRVVQEVLWLFIGYARSMWVAVHIGLALAGVLIVMGITKTLDMGTMNIYMGIFFLMHGFGVRQRIAALRDHYGSLGAVPDPRHEAQVSGWLGRWIGSNGGQAAQAAQEGDAKPAVDRAEIDRILMKVAAHGMASLTPEEMATLRSASE